MLWLNPFLPDAGLSKLYYEFTQKQELHDLAGGFHSVGLSDGVSFPIIIETCRHNCVDKLAGALLWKLQFFAIHHGQWSHQLRNVMKSLAMASVQHISRTTSTTMAIELAEKHALPDRLQR